MKKNCTPQNIKSGAPVSTKRTLRTMSHHEACESRCETSARKDDENLQPCRSYFNNHSPFPSRARNLPALLSFIVLLVTWMSLLGTTLAQETGDQQRSADIFPDPLWKGPSILVDTRPPPVAPYALMHLHRRQDEKKTPTTSAAPSKSSIATDPETTAPGFTVPRPFDTALSNNFTAACDNFFRTFLTNEAFTLCHPFSLLLQVCLPRRWASSLSNSVTDI